MLFQNAVFLSRNGKGISLFKILTPDKTNDESIKWTKYLIDIILKHRVKGQSLMKRMQYYNLYISDSHLIYHMYKLLKEGALPTINFPSESANITAKPCLANAIEKHQEYQLFQEQMPQSVQINRSRISHHKSRAMH